MAKKKSKVKVMVKRTPKKTAELTRLGYALRALGGLGGGMAGGLFGQAQMGQTAGSSLGAAVSRWLGSGDYTVAQNSIVQKTQSPNGSIPSMHNDSQSIIVRHKEYLGAVRGSTGFTVREAYALNPGMPGTFPWLSQVATRFQEYRIRGAVFHYVPTSGSAVSSTNPALGSVMIQTTYRANDSPPYSKMEMMNEYWASESAPNEAFCHPIECNPKENPFNVQYVRSSDVPSGDSVLMYDIGQTFVATSGMIANDNPVGDLWITYEIELKKPVLYSNVSPPNASCLATFTTAPSSNAMFSGSVKETGNIDITIVNSRSLRLKFREGGIYALSVVMVSSTASTWDNTPSPSYTNATIKPYDFDGLLFNMYGRVESTVGPGLVYSGMFEVLDHTLPVVVNWGGTNFTLNGGVSTQLAITQRA